MACPHCQCRCGGEPHPRAEPHPCAEPRERREKLTPEERKQNRRDTQRRYYEKTKVDRREKHHEEQRRWYLANRDTLNEKQRDKRRLAREARATAADNGICLQAPKELSDARTGPRLSGPVPGSSPSSEVGEGSARRSRRPWPKA